MATQPNIRLRGGLLLADLARYIARGLGTALVALVATIAIGQGQLTNLLEPSPVALESAALVAMMAGSLIGWRNERLGGWIVLAGWFLFAGTELAANGSLPGGTILLFGIPGVLYLLSDTFRMFPLPPKS